MGFPGGRVRNKDGRRQRDRQSLRCPRFRFGFGFPIFHFCRATEQIDRWADDKIRAAEEQLVQVKAETLEE